MIDGYELQEEMHRQNPWWNLGRIELKEGLIHREIFDHFMGEIDQDHVTALIGLRRTGKTTLMKQMIDLLLRENEARHIFYFSFDAMEKKEYLVRDVFHLYCEKILGKSPSNLKQRVFIFLDEVQKVENWGEEVKSIWDRGYNIKFVISGSSSMNITRGAGESLVGRIRINRIHPFSFGEYLRFEKTEYPRMDLEGIVQDQVVYPANAQEIRIKFNQYLEFGGFPEIYEKEDKRGYLNDMVSLSFYRDIINMLPVKRIEVLEGMFYHFIRESGQQINYNQMADSLGTKYETIKEYIDHLETSFLVDRSMLYSRSKLKSLRKNPKVYVADHGFSILENMDMGLKVETAVYNHLRRSHEVNYWKGKKEVDMVICTSRFETLPLEVKYKENIRNSDLRGLVEFAKEEKVSSGILVTNNTLKTEILDDIKIHFVPAWLMLLV